MAVSEEVSSDTTASLSSCSGGSVTHTVTSSSGSGTVYSGSSNSGVIAETENTEYRAAVTSECPSVTSYS